MFFSTFFFSTIKIKVDLLDKMKQSTYLCVIYMSRTRKKFIFSPFLLDFYFLVKSKMGAKMTTMFGDVTGLQQRHHPWVYIILSRRSKAFHWKQNRFEILQHIKNLMDSRGSINPSPLEPRWEYDFFMYIQGHKKRSAPQRNFEMEKC